MVSIKEKYELYLGDCLNIMKKISDKNVDLILADLPYGTTYAEFDKIIPMDKLWFEYKNLNHLRPC
jgi:DNA modification methylase